MNENPYAAPQTPPVDEAAVAGRKHARRIVGPPAVALLVLTGPASLFFLAEVLMGLYGIFSYGVFQGIMSNSMMVAAFGVALVFLLLFASHAIVFVGAWKMRRLSSRKWANSAATMPVVPLLSPMFFLGIPFGVWALIVLRRADVKEAFDRR